MPTRRPQRRTAERITAKAQLAEAKSKKRRWLFLIVLAVAAVIVLIRFSL